MASLLLIGRSPVKRQRLTDWHLFTVASDDSSYITVRPQSAIRSVYRFLDTYKHRGPILLSTADYRLAT
jgi:hypothetical protein